MPESARQHFSMPSLFDSEVDVLPRHNSVARFLAALAGSLVSLLVVLPVFIFVFFAADIQQIGELFKSKVEPYVRLAELITILLLSTAFTASICVAVIVSYSTRDGASRLCLLKRGARVTLMLTSLLTAFALALKLLYFARFGSFAVSLQSIFSN